MAWATHQTYNRRQWQWLLFLVIGVVWPVWAAEMAEVEIQGVEKDIRTNILAYIGDVPLESLGAQRTLRLRLDENIDQAMQSLGYYSSHHQIDIQTDRIVITLLPGTPVHVRLLDIDLQGEAEHDPDFITWRSKVPLKVGDVFNHGQYETIKSSLQALATENGYFDAEWIQHEVRIDPVSQQADIHLIYNSGLRYQIGRIRFLQRDGQPQNFVKPKHLNALLPFAENDAYDADKIIELNRSLLNVRYFSDVRIQAQREQTVDNHVPIDIFLATDKPNHMDFGLGYSTDIKARVSAKWQRPLINTAGHGIEINTELSPVRSTLDSKYTIPLTHPLNDTLQFVYGVKREDAQNVINWNTVIGAQRQIKKTGGWQNTYSLRWNRDTTEIPHQQTDKSDLLLPGFSIDRTRSKGGMDPYWGDRQYYQIEGGSEQLLSDVNVVSFRAGFRFLRTLAGKHQFLLRTDAGALATNNFNNVPQSMRFFAGGDQSVRGYAYKSISPRDVNGVVTGAKNVLTGSAEYDYEFIHHWRAAIFSDAGDAFNDVRQESFKVGSGVGIRWISPVGPIRLDVAWAMREPDRPLRIHFSMGPLL